MPSYLSNNATVLDERLIGNTRYILLTHHDNDSTRKYFTGRPNCVVLVEYQDNGSRVIKSTHYRLSDKDSEGFLEPPVIHISGPNVNQ